MYLTYTYIIFVLVSIVSNNAFPLSSSFYYDDIASPIFVDSDIVRRDVFDPYGFNSILTRLTKRNNLYDIYRKRIIHFLDRDEYDSI